MEHDRRESTHNYPGYQTQTAHTPLQTSIIVKAVGRRHHHHSSTSQRLPDFTEKRPPRKTLPQRPHETRVGLCQTDDSSDRSLAALILTMSSEEEICKTRAEKDHHNRTARHRASSPQVHTPHLRLHSRGRPTQRPLGHAGTRADYQSHCRDQTSLISIVVAAQATTRKPLIAGHQPRCRMHPAH
jgi:hypothetical protein